MLHQLTFDFDIDGPRRVFALEPSRADEDEYYSCDDDDDDATRPLLSDEERKRRNEECRRERAAAWCSSCCLALLCLVPVLIPLLFPCAILTGGVCTVAPPPPAMPNVTAPPPGPGTVLSCCESGEDPYVYPGSPWGSASPTLCGDYDYSCDNETSMYACCYDVEPTMVTSDGRILYMVATCAVASNGSALSTDPERVCGACAGSYVEPGWACNTPIDARRRKRAGPLCPDACTAPPVDVTSTTPPALGECALFTDHCVAPPHGGDGEQCCIVIGS